MEASLLLTVFRAVHQPCNCNTEVCCLNVCSLPVTEHTCLAPPQILEQLNKMCGTGVWKKQQRLLKNMGAHKVMLDLLQIPYDKVGAAALKQLL